MPIYKDFVPKFPTAIASSPYAVQGYTVSVTSGGYPSYTLDKNKSGGSYRSSISPALPEYWTLTFPKKVTIGKYQLYMSGNYVTMSTWEFQGRINGGWRTLHVGSSTGFVNGSEFFFTPIEVDAVRIKCNSRPGTNSWGFNEIIIYSYEPIEKTLLLDRGKYKSLLANEGKVVEVSSVTEDNIITHGMDLEFNLELEQEFNKKSFVNQSPIDMNQSKIFTQKINLLIKKATIK